MILAHSFTFGIGFVNIVMALATLRYADRTNWSRLEAVWLHASGSIGLALMYIAGTSILGA